jgi:hypothetical protein
VLWIIIDQLRVNLCVNSATQHRASWYLILVSSRLTEALTHVSWLSLCLMDGGLSLMCYLSNSPLQSYGHTQFALHVWGELLGVSTGLRYLSTKKVLADRTQEALTLIVVPAFLMPLIPISHSLWGPPSAHAHNLMDEITCAFSISISGISDHRTCVYIHKLMLLRHQRCWLHMQVSHLFEFIQARYNLQYPSPCHK